MACLQPSAAPVGTATGMPSWQAVDVSASISSSNHVTRAGSSPGLK
jgi:hypothetical protein